MSLEAEESNADTRMKLLIWRYEDTEFSGTLSLHPRMQWRPSSFKAQCL